MEETKQSNDTKTNKSNPWPFSGKTKTKWHQIDKKLYKAWTDYSLTLVEKVSKNLPWTALYKLRMDMMADCVDYCKIEQKKEDSDQVKKQRLTLTALKEKVKTTAKELKGLTRLIKKKDTLIETKNSVKAVREKNNIMKRREKIACRRMCADNLNT